MPRRSVSDRQDPPTGQRHQRRRRRWWALAVSVALLLPAGAAAGTSLFTEGFPERDVVSCTVSDSVSLSARRSFIRERVLSDCGSFRSAKVVTCTTNPSTEIALSPGTTYDLVVRGPRIPLISAPKIFSATVSPQQRFVDDAVATKVDPSASENLQAMQRSLLPETLRAFDYEQPAFDPSCDPYRVVMTTGGLQVVSTERAALLLAVPEATVPRTPKLSCEGYQCQDPDAHR